MARTVNAERLVTNMDATSEPKKQLMIILEVLAGKRSIADACEELHVSEATFHRMRDQALQGALDGLAPLPAGRPAKKVDEKDEKILALEEQLAEMGVELEAERVRTIMAIVKPELLKDRHQKKSPRNPKSSSSQDLFRDGSDTRPS